jgi:hypothetical protein
MGDREMSEDDLFAVPPGGEFCYLATMRIAWGRGIAWGRTREMGLSDKGIDGEPAKDPFPESDPKFEFREVRVWQSNGRER